VCVEHIAGKIAAMALLLTAAQMRAIDSAVTEKLGLPGLVLMENAGRGVAEIIARSLAQVPGLDVRIVCGAGQNGGDGFVVARHLLRRGAKVRVLLALPREKLTGDAAVFAKVLGALSADCIRDLSSENEAKVWQSRLAGAAVVVDALFGTGLRSQITGAPAAAIAGMNATDALRVSVDIPSGLDADTATVHSCVVQAHITATMGCRKLGLVLDANAPVGRLEVVDLGVAPESVLGAALEHGQLCHWLEPEDIACVLPVHGPTDHKGSAGHLLVIAGSVGKTGAALLSARAAMRSGVGLVTIATTGSAQAALDAKVVSEMTSCYAQGEAADDGSLATLVGQAARMKAAVLGPGIPTGPGMTELVRRLVADLTIPMVIDADALNLLGTEAATVCTKAAGPRILTPHPGEMARLCGLSTADVAKDRLGLARRLASQSGAVVVLKGARTIVALSDGTAYVNPTATASLGTAGSGDVLSGTIGAFLAQGLAPKDAACAGVFLHGAAADEATRALGSGNLIATDLPDAIARACEALRPV
jgi:ADP-dependent NAD(P)H-hydrate dehydratase / NAD(P)H-hydrate epimerase